MAYNIESIIAEKFQTVISKGILNSRMKDYYDLYYLMKYKEFSKENLKIAIEKTFYKRNTDLQSTSKVITEIGKSDFLENLWELYSQKYQYAKNIKFKEVITSISEVNKILYEN